MFQERLNQLLRDRDISQSELAERLGRTRACINSWVKRGNEPHSRELIEKIAEVLETTPGYLLFGIDDEKSTTVWNRVRPDESDDGFVLIPAYDVSASCGTNAVNNTSERLIRLVKVAKEWLRAHAPYANKATLNVISASGDSMSPTAESGDMVIVDRSVNTFCSDSLYVFQRDGELFLKRIQKISNGIRVISDNERYPPYEIKSEDLESIVVVGKVCTIGKFSDY